jgi:uncharacterized protein YcbK (DUF882 family)
MSVPGLAAVSERRIAMRNLHTGERAEIAYWSNGRYLQDGLSQVNQLLRDHRREEVHPIAPQLLDALNDLGRAAGAREDFHIISGYRSPRTNALLRNKSRGVAKRSFHMLGQAVDIRLPGCDLARLHRQALGLRAGGVGLYRRSNFIHLDIGPVRQWVG